MAEYISFQPSDYFNTTLYAGDSDAAGHAITGVGFQPDLVWIKARNEAQNHALNDSARGVLKLIESDTTAIEDTASTGLSAFGADGFTVKNMGQINATGNNYVSWNWKAGTTSGITTNGSTTITPTAYSFNQTAGISILKFTGNYTNGAKLAHGLGVAPEMVFFKTLENVSTWGGYNKTITATDYIKLDSSDAATAYALAFAETEPDAVNITLGSWEAVNGNVGTTGMVAYAFASKKGFSKIGSYAGNANADGPFIYTGFRPAFILIKRYTGVDDWIIFDSKREGYNIDNDELYPNTTGAEGTADWIDILSNGFKPRTTHDTVNKSGHSYIYMAFAEFPIVSSNDVPTVAR